MKVWNFFFIGITLLIVFDIFGILNAGVLLSVLGFHRIGEDISFNPTIMQGIILGFLAVVGVGGAIAGLFGKQIPENYVTIAAITANSAVLILIINVYLGIWTAAADYPSYLKAIISIIIVPFVAGYLIALLEWFRGTD